MPHRPLVNLLDWHQRHPRLREPARTLQFAPITFDVSFQDLVATWCTGGTVVVVSDALRRDPVALVQFLETMEIKHSICPSWCSNNSRRCSVRILLVWATCVISFRPERRCG